MRTALAIALVLAFIATACAGAQFCWPNASCAGADPSRTLSPTTISTPASATSPRPTPTTPTPSAPGVAALIEQIDMNALNDHLVALTSVVSRDVHHPGHAQALGYLKEQLGAMRVQIESYRNVYQGIPLESLLVTIDPLNAPPTAGWIMICAHYDSVSNRSPNWNPAITAAPGADDNGTGTAALLEYARILSANRASLRHRVVLAFFDGEELFFKGSGAYVTTLPTPYPYSAVINIDMVGFNPITDRLDLIWYTNGSAGLRDKLIAANDRYAIGISPLNAQFAGDGNTILDAAPFGLAGMPAVALVQRYGENDATFPGNYTFHTVSDTPANVSNRRLWLKAAKLTLAAALDLATAN
ncbi:MAG TPA: M20/M25/M40 family metallo-hydrolase [Candidatus Limnocylindria bacterium]|nr:M20/M25/M40 family metallo-hydrolase [Candidatus Limnocylindria bacterium]